jgi:hypothetical protein
MDSSSLDRTGEIGKYQIRFAPDDTGGVYREVAERGIGFICSIVKIDPKGIGYRFSAYEDRVAFWFLGTRRGSSYSSVG